MHKHKRHSNYPAFTIVELLVVIVVIAVLAAITIVSYTGITAKANLSSIQSDLSNAATLLKNYGTTYGSFPTTLDASYCPTAPNVDTNYCLKASNGNTLAYSSVAPKTFRLTATKGNTSYAITNNTAPAITTTVSGSAIGSACPTGFIPVPGSGTYGTDDFCVMKYEAKADDNADGTGDTSQTTGSNTWPANAYPIASTRKLVSTAQGYPIANIAQGTAATAASSYTNGCDSGCHLITEAEWLTIAQNVLSVASNWNTGTVGSGYIYSGHNDNAPANALEASTTDSDGYYGETNIGGNQRRTLTLTNGQVIWDLAGNVWEWTSGQTTGGQPGLIGESAYAWKQWNAVTIPGNLSSPNPSLAATGLSGTNAWTSANGIGQLYSNVGETGLRSFIRSGNWGLGSAGALCLILDGSPARLGPAYGFRVTR